MRFEVFQGGIFRRRWYWHLVADNNEIVCQSQGYKEKQSAVNTCRSIRINMAATTAIHDEMGVVIPDAWNVDYGPVS